MLNNSVTLQQRNVTNLEKIRLQKIIFLLQKWNQNLLIHLTILCGNEPKKSDDFIVKLERCYLLDTTFTVAKSQFFQSQLTHLPSIQVNRHHTLQQLQLTKITLQQQIRNNEKKLATLIGQNHYSYTIRLMSYGALTMQQLPTYQLAALTTDLVSQLLQGLNIIKIDAPAQSLLNRLVKPLVLCVWLISNGYVYSHQGGLNAYLTYNLVTATSSMLINHFDMLLILGESSDNIMRNFNEIMRTDNLGILQKTKTLQWLLGLGTHLLINTGTQISAGFAYSAASSVSYVTKSIANWLLGSNTKPQTRQWVDVFTSMTSYALSYPSFFGYAQGWQTGGQCPNADMTINTAQSRLGFFAKPKNPAEIRRHFRNRAKLWHEDKITTHISKEEKTFKQQQLHKLNNAKECLLNKFSSGN